MNCMKCGREIEESRVFCDTCLEEMEKHPVKPGTVVHIPKRPDTEEEKKVTFRRKQILTEEEQIRRLKKKLVWLRMIVAALLIVCGALTFVLGKAVMKLDVRKIIGQNYSTVESIPTTRGSK